MIKKETNKGSTTWEETGKNAAAEIKISPKKIEYIESRGYLCHELLYLLDGHIEFVETSWKQYVLKILELLFPISPICRWHPPEDCILEWVGYHSQYEIKAYRLTPREGSIIVFFVNYKPEPPVGGGYVRPFFNVPQLDISQFLRPPFEENNNNIKIEQLLREGIVEKFEPLPLTSGAKNIIRETDREVCKGLWEVLSK
jgi:hypothetical protein